MGYKMRRGQALQKGGGQYFRHAEGEGGTTCFEVVLMIYNCIGRA